MYLFLYIHTAAFLTSGSSKGGKFKLPHWGLLVEFCENANEKSDSLNS